VSGNHPKFKDAAVLNAYPRELGPNRHVIPHPLARFSDLNLAPNLYCKKQTEENYW
jgi:hypothetical protein